VGDWVSGEYAGRRFSGTVMAAGPGRVAVQIDYLTITVPPSAIDE
jgi:hypothetical protein